MCVRGLWNKHSNTLKLPDFPLPLESVNRIIQQSVLVCLPGLRAQPKGLWLGNSHQILDCYIVHHFINQKWVKKKKKKEDKWRLKLTCHVGSVSGLLPVARLGKRWQVLVEYSIAECCAVMPRHFINRKTFPLDLCSPWKQTARGPKIGPIGHK